MNLKNYTSTVPVERSVAQIERRLVAHGAHDILKLYEEKKLTGIAFIATIEGQKPPELQMFEKLWFLHRKGSERVLSIGPQTRLNVRRGEFSRIGLIFK